MTNTIRSITIKRLNAADTQQEIDDSMTVKIDMFHKTATLIKLFQASQSDQSVKVEADKVFAFNNTVNNMHRLQKQMRAYQRAQSIRFSTDKTLTHYVYAKKRIKIDTRNVKETCVANTLAVYHLYSAKVELSADDFKALVKFIENL